jgi:hypothetical protein
VQTVEAELRRDLAARLDRYIVVLRNLAWLDAHGYRIDRCNGVIRDRDDDAGFALHCLAEEGFTPATRDAA